LYLLVQSYHVNFQIEYRISFSSLFSLNLSIAFLLNMEVWLEEYNEFLSHHPKQAFNY
jgi:hypothetical protein